MLKIKAIHNIQSRPRRPLSVTDEIAEGQQIREPENLALI